MDSGAEGAIPRFTASISLPSSYSFYREEQEVKSIDSRILPAYYCYCLGYGDSNCHCYNPGDCDQLKKSGACSSPNVYGPTSDGSYICSPKLPQPYC